MKLLNFGKLRTFLGILLVLGVFVFPITYTSFTFPVSAENVYTRSDDEKFGIAKLMHKEKIGKIDSFLEQHRRTVNFQGNVLVRFKGNLIYSKAFGFSNPRAKSLLTEESVFQLASVTKQFTAMGIMILKEKGLLNYSDTIDQYIKNFPYKGITVKMLLNHTSGLPNYMWLLEHHWNKNKTPYNSDVMDLLAKHRLHLYFKPGTRFAYSNTGYVVLASLIEKVTGQRYDEFMEKNIFDPLGMENTYVYSTSYGEDTMEHVNGYRHWGNHYRYIPNTINDGTVGDKGIYSTILDLYRWDMGLYENTLVAEQTKKQAFEALELKNGNHYPYGFGFRLKESDGKKMVYHYGKWNGFRTGIIRFIEDTSTIIILNHTDRPYNSRITSNVGDILNERT